MQPDQPPQEPGDEGNVTDPSVFAARRMSEGPESLLARASAAERAVVSLQSRLQEIERELQATGAQRDELAAALQQREVTLRETAASPPPPEDFAAVRALLQTEIQSLSARLVRADDRVAELQTELARARGDVLDAQHEQAAQRAAIELARRDDTDRDARLRRAEVEIDGRLQALRAAEAEAAAVRDALDRRRTGLETRLREVDGALVELAARVEHEQQARLHAEASLAAERAARESQATTLRAELDVRSSRVADVQRTLSDLRGELVRVLETGVIADDGAKERIAEAEERQRLLEERALTVERERDEAVQAFVSVKEQVTRRESELIRLRGEAGSANEQVHVLRTELRETRSALDAALAAQTAANAEAGEERLARETAEAQLESERATYSQQLAVADERLRREIDTQRQAFDEHAAAVDRSIETLHEQLAAARASMDAAIAQEVERREAAEEHAREAHALLVSERAAISTDELEKDLADAAARLRELAAEAGVEAELTPEVVEPVEAPPLAGDIELRDQAGELAQVIEESKAPDAGADLPRRELPAAAPEAWMAPAIEKLFERDPQAAGRALVGLLPAVAAAYPRDGLIDFAVDELGAYRLTLHMRSGSITPWRSGASRQADLALAGSVLDLAPFAVGGAPRRKPRGAEHTGKRRALRALLKARREPVSLTDLQAARVVPPLGSLLELLAAAVKPEWIEGRKVVVGFDSTGPGAGSWVLRTSEDGQITIAPGRAEGADALITVPAQGVVPLFIGGEPPVAGKPVVTGSAEAALAVLGWFDRAQREIS